MQPQSISVCLNFFMLLVMGNLIATSASIIIPMVNKLIIVPYVFHPYRWGGVPWSQPSDLLIMFANFALNIVMLMGAGTLSGIMTTEAACNRHDTWIAFKRSAWIILGYLVGNWVVFALPIIKAPMLAILSWLPYAGLVVHGLLVAFWVMLFGAIGNSVNRADVC